jgi:hypothetical protein
MPRCPAAGLDFRIVPGGLNAPLEFLTRFIRLRYPLFQNQRGYDPLLLQTS